MDFFTIASEQHRLLRKLEEMLGVDSAGNSEIPSQGPRPLLSKTAESELFLLATNFLLYVAMVIIVTIVCKIYFPEMLRSRAGAEDYQIRSRNINYRVAQREGVSYEDNDESAPSDDDDDDDEILDSDSDDYLVHMKSRSSISAERNQANFLEFQQESMPKSQVLKRLVFCSIMLNVTFVTWGVLQVRKGPAYFLPFSIMLDINLWLN
jgi:hypothetical protein